MTKSWLSELCVDTQVIGLCVIGHFIWPYVKKSLLLNIVWSVLCHKGQGELVLNILKVIGHKVWMSQSLTLCVIGLDSVFWIWLGHLHYVVIVYMTFCQYVTMSLCQYCHLHIMFNVCVSLCQCHHVSFILSLSLCQCFYVIVTMSVSLCHYVIMAFVTSWPMCSGLSSLIR